MTFIRQQFSGRKHAWAGFALALVLTLIALPGSLQARDVNLAWDGNTESDLAGYKVYYGLSSSQYGTIVDVGSRTSYTITGLDDTKDYYIVTTAYNTAGAESTFSNEVASAATGVLIPPDSPSNTSPSTPSAPSDTTSPSSSSSDSGGGGGGCFIATAAYGSYLAPEVMVLRHFRDHWLLTNRPGTLFVKCYYRYSPPVADFISKNEWLRSLTRWALTPIVYSLKYSISALMFLMVLAGSVYFRRKRTAREAACRIPMPVSCERSTR